MNFVQRTLPSKASATVLKATMSALGEVHTDRLVHLRSQAGDPDGRDLRPSRLLAANVPIISPRADYESCAISKANSKSGILRKPESSQFGFSFLNPSEKNKSNTVLNALESRPCGHHWARHGAFRNRALKTKHASE